MFVLLLTLLLIGAPAPDPRSPAPEFHAPDFVGDWQCNWAGGDWNATLTADGGWKATNSADSVYEGSWSIQKDTLIIVERMAGTNLGPWTVNRIKLSGQRKGTFPTGGTFSLSKP